MADTVSGFDHYDFYLDEGLPGERKLNAVPIAEGEHFTPIDLDSATDYSDRITAVPVDKASNATRPGQSYAGLDVLTLDPTPEQSPMSAPRVAEIDAVMARCIAAGAGPSVTIGILSPFGHLLKTYGAAGTGVDLNYLVASQTKLFTAHAVLQQIDAALYSRTDTLEDLGMTGYPNGGLITVQMLLNHTSGVYDPQLDAMFGLQFTLNPQMAQTVDQMIGRVKAGAPMFVPGEGYHYTNSNYFVLGKIVEKFDAATRPLETILAEDIYGPAGMADTYLQTVTGAPRAPNASAFDYNPILAIFGLLLARDVRAQNPAMIWASGSAVTKVGNMLKFGEAMRSGLLLDGEYTNWITAPPDEDAHPMPPWGITKQGPTTYKYKDGLYHVGSWKGHGGSWLGTDTATMFEPVTGTVITCCQNFQSGLAPSMTLVWYELAEYLFPSSANQPGYMTGEDASGTSGSAFGKMSTAGEGTVFEPGEFPPRDERNDFKVDEPVPAGASYLRVIKLQGKGGNGASGTSVYNSTGGSGGGSGARIPAAAEGDLLIPVAALGSTYTTRINASGDAEFLSGSLRLSAKAGGAGTMTTAYNATASGGAAGTWEAVGATGLGVTGANGVPGGNSHMQGGAPGGSGVLNDVGGSGAGGRGSYGGLSGGVQKGGDSLTVEGTTGPGGDAAGDGAGAGGGEGQPGGKYGAGGGGGYSYGNVGGQLGKPGGSALVHIGWE